MRNLMIVSHGFSDLMEQGALFSLLLGRNSESASHDLQLADNGPSCSKDMIM